MTQPDSPSTGGPTTAPAKKTPRRPTFRTAAVTAPTADDVLSAPAAAAPAAAEPAAPPAVEPAAAAPSAPVVDPDTVVAAPVSKAAAAPAATGKPIRVTVELEFDEHRQLRRLCDRYADEIGVAQVAGAEAFRALLHLALDDDTVARKLGKALARSGGSRRRS